MSRKPKVSIQNDERRQEEIKTLREEYDRVKRKRMEVRVTCGTCQFFRRGAIFGQPCYLLGTTPNDDPCSRFIVNPSKLHMQEESTQELLDIVSKLEQSQLDTLAALLHTGKAVFRAGFVPGQTVYFQIVQSDYLRSYVRGRIIGANKTHVFLHGQGNIIATLLPQSLMTRAEWREKRASLIQSNRIDDPDCTVRKTKLKVTLNYNAPVFSKKDYSELKEPVDAPVKSIKGKNSYSLRG